MNQGHDVLEKIIRNKMNMSKNSVLFVVNKSEDAKEIELYLSTLLDLGCEDFHFLEGIQMLGKMHVTFQILNEDLKMMKLFL